MMKKRDTKKQPKSDNKNEAQTEKKLPKIP